MPSWGFKNRKFWRLESFVVCNNTEQLLTQMFLNVGCHCFKGRSFRIDLLEARLWDLKVKLSALECLVRKFSLFIKTYVAFFFRGYLDCWRLFSCNLVWAKSQIFWREENGFAAIDVLHCRSNLVQFISLQPVRASVSNVYPSYDTFEHKFQFQRRSFYVHSLKFRIFCKELFYVLRSLTCKCVLTLPILFISTSAITLFEF